MRSLSNRVSKLVKEIYDSLDHATGVEALRVHIHYRIPDKNTQGYLLRLLDDLERDHKDISEVSRAYRDSKTRAALLGKALEKYRDIEGYNTHPLEETIMSEMNRRDRYKVAENALVKSIGEKIGIMAERFYAYAPRKPEHPHGHKIALLAIVLASVGLGGWLWIWNSLQETPATSFAVAASPAFTPFNLLFSVLIFAGLVYSVEHFEREIKQQ